ncbi:MAG: hypothetical protein ACYC7E_12100 [Armatimonadota bacterium]
MACSIIQAGQPTASWDGLVGLYTHPTAEMLTEHRAALTFSEIRFTESNSVNRLLNYYVESSLTYIPAPRWEVALTLRDEQVHHFLEHDASFLDYRQEYYLTGGLKYILQPVEPDRLGLAVGVMDVANATETIDGQDTERGRRFFLVGSYNWAHLGLTYDGKGVGAYAGARWTILDNLDLIGEYVTNPTFVQTNPLPECKVNFNLGVRYYPRELPNLRIDMTAVGNSNFNYGFSLSYLL